MTITIKFVEPTTYEEASAMMGQDAHVDTPIGSLTCRNAGRSGDDIHVGFGTIELGGIIYSAIDWSTKHGWETAAEMKARCWTEGFDKLPKNAQELITISFSEELEAMETSKRKSADRLVAVAKIRAVKKGIIEERVCGRCGGRGHYSYNQMDGTKCFGCHGSGKKLPSTSATLKAVKAKGVANV